MNRNQTGVVCNSMIVMIHFIYKSSGRGREREIEKRTHFSGINGIANDSIKEKENQRNDPHVSHFRFRKLLNGNETELFSLKKGNKLSVIELFRCRQM